jgi:hypothetical protein
MFSESITIEFSLTIPPILIFFLLISVKLLISVGEKKYTTSSSKDFKIKNMESITETSNKDMNKILNLTFLPYMLERS